MLVPSSDALPGALPVGANEFFAELVEGSGRLPARGRVATGVIRVVYAPVTTPGAAGYEDVKGLVPDGTDA